MMTMGGYLSCNCLIKHLLDNYFWYWYQVSNLISKIRPAHFDRNFFSSLYFLICTYQPLNCRQLFIISLQVTNFHFSLKLIKRTYNYFIITNYMYRSFTSDYDKKSKLHNVYYCCCCCWCPCCHIFCSLSRILLLFLFLSLYISHICIYCYWLFSRKDFYTIFFIMYRHYFITSLK